MPNSAQPILHATLVNRTDHALEPVPVAQPHCGCWRSVPRSIKPGEIGAPAFEVEGQIAATAGTARWRIGDTDAELTIGWSLVAHEGNAFSIHCDDPGFFVTSDGIQHTFAEQCFVTFSLGR